MLKQNIFIIISGIWGIIAIWCCAHNNWQGFAANALVSIWQMLVGILYNMNYSTTNTTTNLPPTELNSSISINNKNYQPLENMVKMPAYKM